MAVLYPVFQRFVGRTMAATMEQCHADVACMTKYVAWDFNAPSRDALHALLVEPVHEALEARFAKETAIRDAKRGRRRRWIPGGGRADDGGVAPEDAAIGSYDELVSRFTETLMTRRVSEPIRLLMSELVAEVIRAWREEFCRAISVKLNAGFLLPFCEALPNYMRKEVPKQVRAMGFEGSSGGAVGEGGVGEGGAGDGIVVEAGGLDPRTSRLRQSIDERLQEKETLTRIANRMRGRLGVPRKVGE